MQILFLTSEEDLKMAYDLKKIEKLKSEDKLEKEGNHWGQRLNTHRKKNWKNKMLKEQERVLNSSGVEKIYTLTN